MLRRYIMCFFSLVFWLAAGAKIHAQAIWVSPVDDQIQPRGFQVDSDYLQLFEDHSPWTQARSHTKVFKIVRRYIATQPEYTLQRIFSFLRRHNIALAVEFGFVPAKQCGMAIEGTAHRPDENLLVARRIKRLGGNLAFMVADSPLYFGHYEKAKGSCEYPIPELALGLSNQVRLVKSVFPAARYVEIEPSSGIVDMKEFEDWIQAEKRELGDDAPRVIHFDVQWYRPWQQSVPKMLEVMRRNAIQYGVIYKGTFQDQTDVQWIASTKKHAEVWEETITTPPSDIIFQSWEPHPTMTLPETSKTSFTYLIDWYCSRLPIPNACK